MTKILFPIDQAEAIRQGINTSSTHAMVDVRVEELTTEQRELLATHVGEKEGWGRCLTTSYWSLVRPTHEEVATKLAADIAKKAAEKAAYAAEKERKLAQDREALAANPWSEIRASESLTDEVRARRKAIVEEIIAALLRGENPTSYHHGQPYYAARYNIDQDPRVVAYCKAREAEEKAREAEEKAREVAQRRARDAVIVERWGDESVRERFAEGVLPDEEIQELFEGVAFAAFDRFSLSEHVEWSDLDHEDCHGNDTVPTVHQNALKTFAAEQWSTLKAIRAAAETLPKSSELDLVATVDPLDYEIVCDSRGCEAVGRRHCARVTVTFGHRKARREYAL